MTLKLRHSVDFGERVIRQGSTPHPFAFSAVTVLEKLGETRDQIGLGKQQVDRCENLQRLGQLLNTLTQIFCKLDGHLGARLRQLGQTGGDQDAVDGRFWALLLQQA